MQIVPKYISVPERAGTVHVSFRRELVCGRQEGLTAATVAAAGMLIFEVDHGYEYTLNDFRHIAESSVAGDGRAGRKKTMPWSRRCRILVVKGTGRHSCKRS